MNLTEYEYTQGYWCAYNHVKENGIDFALEYLYGTDLEDPFWEGYKAYVEEVM